MINERNLNKNVKALTRKEIVRKGEPLLDYFFEKSVRLLKKIYTVTIKISLKKVD